MCATVTKNNAGSKGEKPGARLMWDLTASGQAWKGNGFSSGNGVNFRAELTRSGDRLRVKGCKLMMCRSSYYRKS